VFSRRGLRGTKGLARSDFHHEIQLTVDARLFAQIIEVAEGTYSMNRLSAYQLTRDQVVSSGSENPWAIRNPLDEARDLHRMVIHGSCSVDSVRDLISVPPEIESALLAYADRYPKDGQRIHCVLQFRRNVGVEFERLLHCDMSFVERQQAGSEDDVSEAAIRVESEDLRPGDLQGEPCMAAVIEP
jgi:hypothetical protein